MTKRENIEKFDIFKGKISNCLLMKCEPIYRSEYSSISVQSMVRNQMGDNLSDKALLSRRNIASVGS